MSTFGGKWPLVTSLLNNAQRSRNAFLEASSFNLPERRRSLPVPHFDYQRIRYEAHGLAAEDASAAIPPIHVRIGDIDEAALTAFASTWEGRHPSGYGGFDWKYLWHRLCRQEPRNFQCALWHGSMLCGLAMGTVPRGHSHLTIRYMEGRPQGHPLHGHVARIVMAATEYYALGLNLPQVRIENPAPGLEAWYRELGFSLAFRQGAVRYLAMDLPNDRGEE